MNLQISPRVSQGMTMTPQMQEAISLLQYTNTGLRQYIEKEAEDNPFIEFGDTPAASTSAEAPAVAPGPAYGAGQSSHGLGDAGDVVARLAERPISLVAHVAQQFDILFSDPEERRIADRFLEALGPHGWLGEPLSEIAFAAGLDMEAAEHFLHAVQRVEPAGLFARDLAECLTLQAQERGLLTPIMARILDHLPRLAAADMTGLMRLCDCNLRELREVLKAIRTLNPKPGADFDGGAPLEREPDLILQRIAGEWQVELNRSTLPAVPIDESAARAMRLDVAAREYASERLRVARWLRRAVEHRNHTTLAIAAEIVRRQSAFLEHGEAYMAPMTLADVAEAVGMHESTVSRVTTGMLMVTPFGTLPLKRFFSTALSTGSEMAGDATSATAVRYRIQKIVAAEDPARPLSDDAIAQAINDGGPVLARRTVAKYRDMLKIPSSFQRKRQARLQGA
ncbi:MAG: RNA polymerase factor sigma-54 [Pseudomonadota bacterium]